MGAVRDIALAGVGWGGGVSTVLTQLSLFIPLGTTTFRSALISCLALAVLSRSLFRVALRMLRSAERSTGEVPSRYAAPALAAIATMIATMTPTFQSEGTVGGSAMVAAALAIWVVDRAMHAVSGSSDVYPHRGFVALGFVIGAITAERAILGVCAAVTVASVVWLGRSGGVDRVSVGGRRLIPLRIARASTIAATIGAAVFTLPSLLRAQAAGVPLNFGGLYPWTSILPRELSPGTDLMGTWTTEIGWSALAMAGFGVFTLAIGKARWMLAAPIATVLADLVLRRLVGPTESSVGLRLVALGWTACVSTVGVHAFFTKLIALRVPLARAGAALIIAFFATLVALTVEQASETSNRANQHGAEAYTDLALDRLPPRAAALVSSPRVTWRLLAATLVEGRRPDAFIIARSALHRGDTAARTMMREPSTEPLVRSIALTGASDEFALSEIADVRPLFVEPESAWTTREYAHVSIDGAWLRFEPEPLGASDRRVDVELSTRRLGPLFQAVDASRTDDDSAAIARQVVSQHAKALLKSGDNKNANAYLAAVDRPGTRIVVSGSLEVAFAATLAHMPSNKASDEREKIRAKVREAERRAAPDKQKRKR